MKRSLLILSCILTCHSLSFADRPNNLAVNLGGAFPLTDIDLTDQGGGKERIGKAGSVVGVQYLRDLTPNVGVGADFNVNAFGENNSDTLIPGAHTTLQPTNRVFLGVVKYKIIPAGQVQPYILGGFGLHNSHLDSDATPQNGFVWANTGTRETRKLVDDTKSSYAVALAGGLDFPVNEGFYVGLEARYQHLGEVTYDTTTSAQQTFGVASVKGPMNMFDLSVKAGFRF